MCSENIIRRFAGVIILSAVALSYLVNPWFLLIVVLAGVNLFQSSFTNWCPLERVLVAAGFPGCPSDSKV